MGGATVRRVVYFMMGLCHTVILLDSCTLTCPDEDQNSLSVKCKVDLSRLFLEKGKNAHAGTPVRDIPFLFFRGGG